MYEEEKTCNYNGKANYKTQSLNDYKTTTRLSKAKHYKLNCSMIAFFSFDPVMVYIPECKKYIRTMK